MDIPLDTCQHPAFAYNVNVYISIYSKDDWPFSSHGYLSRRAWLGFNVNTSPGWTCSFRRWLVNICPAISLVLSLTKILKLKGEKRERGTVVHHFHVVWACHLADCYCECAAHQRSEWRNVSHNFIFKPHTLNVLIGLLTVVFYQSWEQRGVG